MRTSEKLRWGGMTRNQRKAAKKDLGPTPDAHLYLFTKLSTGEWIKQAIKT